MKDVLSSSVIFVIFMKGLINYDIHPTARLIRYVCLSHCDQAASHYCFCFGVAERNIRPHSRESWTGGSTRRTWSQVSLLTRRNLTGLPLLNKLNGRSAVICRMRKKVKIKHHDSLFLI